jgi:hypothetical protein
LDSTGTHLAAAASSYAGNMFGGTNLYTGAWTWTEQAVSGLTEVGSVASDSTGAHLMAAGGSLYLGSFASGWSWTIQDVPAGGLAASNADGTVLAAASSSDIFFNSNGSWADQGAAWGPGFPTGQDWSALAMDASGQHVAVASSNGDVWTTTCGNGNRPQASPSVLIGLNGATAHLLYAGDNTFYVVSGTGLSSY